MARFGVFLSSGGPCVAEHEGDYLEQRLQFVVIFKKEAAKDEGDLVVAAFYLDKNQCIKIIEGH
jgi:hypothetical protein